MIRKTKTGLIFTLCLLLLANCSYSLADEQEEKSPFCLKPRTYTMEDVEQILESRPQLKKFWKAGSQLQKMTEKDVAAEYLQCIFPPETSLLGGIFTSGNLAGFKGFEALDTCFTDIGLFFALAQFTSDIDRGKYVQGTVNMAKNSSYWYIGRFAKSTVLKICTLAIIVIDYSLNKLGSSVIGQFNEFWFKAYRDYYDNEYGREYVNNVKGIEKWEKIIIQKYDGDMERFVNEGLKDFWAEPYMNALPKFKKFGTGAVPHDEEKENIRKKYLAKLLPKLRTYYKERQKQVKKELLYSLQYNFNMLVEKMNQITIFGGIVRSKSGKRIKGVPVSLMDKRTVQTDDNGYYEIRIRVCDLYWELVQWRKKHGGGRPKPIITAEWEGKKEKKEVDLEYLSDIANEADFAFDARHLEALVFKETSVIMPPQDLVSLKVAARYDDGTEKDITQEAEWHAVNDLVTVKRGDVKSLLKTGESGVYVTYSFKEKTLKTPVRKIKIQAKVTLQKIKLEPASLVLQPEKTHQMKVIAVFSDGTEKEITSLPDCKWNSSDENVAVVTDGEVSAGTKSGDCHVYCAYTFEGKTVLSQNAQITLVIPKKKIILPNLIAKKEDYAIKILADLGLKTDVSLSSVHDSVFPPQSVIYQKPLPGKEVEEGTTVELVINIFPKVSIGMRILPEEKREYPQGTSLQFEETLMNKNPQNTYTYIWNVDGDEIKREDIPGSSEQRSSLSHKFTEPVRHYVQLVIESTDPKENDAIIKDIYIQEIEKKASCQIVAVPDEKVYTPPVDILLSFQCTVDKNVLKPSQIENARWFVNGHEKGTGISFSLKLEEKGVYSVKLILRVQGVSEEITTEKSINTKEKTAIPAARKVNRFEGSGAPEKLNLLSSYWRGGMTPARWSNPAIFRTIGPVNKHIIVTPDAAGGYNTGFLVYSPKGSKKLLFEVYAFNFERHIGVIKYSGQLDLHGKTLKPESLNFEKTGCWAVTVSWKTTDGSLCKAEIWKNKVPEQGQSNVFINGGVKDLGCIELKTLPGKIVKPMCSDDQIWATFPSAEDFGIPGAEVKKNKGQYENMSLNYDMYLKKGTDAENKMVIVCLNLYGSNKTAKAIWDAMFKMGKNNKKMKTVPPMDGIYRTANREVFILLDNAHLFYKGMHTKMGKGKPPTIEYFAIMNVALEAWLKRVKNPPCSLVPPGLETAEGVAEIKEVNWGKTTWPIRIQDGVLEVRGSGYEGYTWKKAWIKVADGVKEYIAEGSGAGPIIAWTSDGKNWNIITLHYSSGIRKNPRSFSEPVETIQGAKNGAYVKVGDWCYSYAFEALKEIDCDTRKYK